MACRHLPERRYVKTMKLISCHIENFGKLQNISMDFTQGVNILCQENGWGKSTFAAFLRVMFYGFMGEGKRSNIEKERARFKPWQGGAYGGQLVFEVAGKEYLVTRSFGNKEAEDVFELRDAKTNLVSRDYSANLGEEIFKINRESFLRTLFIGQNDCGSGTTDDINAKIGNLTEDTGDMNRYEAASDRLTALMNRLTPKYKKGSINQRKDEIATIERRVKNGESISESIAAQQKLLEDERKAYEEAKKEMERWSHLAETLSVWDNKKAQLGGRIETYTFSEQENADYEVLKRQFAQNAPTDEALEHMRRQIEEYTATKRERDASRLTSEEQERLSNLASCFENSESTAQDMVALWSQREAKQLSLPAQEAHLTAMEASIAQEKKKRSKAGILLVVGLVLLLCGCVSAMYATSIGFVVMAVGVILFILGLVFKSKKSGISADETSLLEMRRSLVDIRAKIAEIEQQICDYLYDCGREYEENNVVSQLHVIAAEEMEYHGLCKKAVAAENTQKEEVLLKLEQEIEAFFTTYYQVAKQPVYTGTVDAANSYLERLFALRENRKKYFELKKKEDDLIKAKAELLQFEQQQEMLSLAQQGIEKIPTIGELTERTRKLTDELESIKDRINTYISGLDELHEKYDQWETDKELLEELKQTQAEELSMYQNVERAADFLKQAKEAITLKYTAPIKASFDEYFQQIVGEAGERFRLDANVKMEVQEQGQLRDLAYLSQGYQDLVHICLRIALVDAMYTEEAPMIIMDDPFTNLDDTKMEMAKALLGTIAQKYQVVYFTCSGYRK